MKVILAQLFLAGIPFAASESKAQLNAAAVMLEDRDESRTFAEYLRGEQIK